MDIRVHELMFHGPALVIEASQSRSVPVYCSYTISREGSLASQVLLFADRT